MFEEKSLAELLTEIEEKHGAYSRDHLTHAENCIEHMSQCATEFKKRLGDMLYLARVRCKNCADSNDSYCEICAKQILEGDEKSK